MGRLLVFIVLAVLVVPAVLLGRLWRDSTGRRLVDQGSIELIVPSVSAEVTMRRWTKRARAVRTGGLVVGVGLVVALAVTVGFRSVFLWPLALGLGVLLGIELGELSRPRPRWPRATSTAARIRRADVVAPALGWWLRAATLGALVLGFVVVSAAERSRAGDAVLAVVCGNGGNTVVPSAMSARNAGTVLALVGLSWLASEAAVLRVVRWPAVEQGDDGPVDEALRSMSAHAAIGAASVLSLFGLAALALVTGFAAVAGCGQSDLTSIGLIGTGFAAALAGLVVVAFLPGWLRPVMRRSAVRS